MNFASRLMMLSQRAKNYLVKYPKPEMRSPLLNCWPELSKLPNITDYYYYPLNSSERQKECSYLLKNTMPFRNCLEASVIEVTRMSPLSELASMVPGVMKVCTEGK